MITIGQLARHVGVSTKTVRVYHAKGLLTEPPRDAAGYRRYTARDVVELVRIRALAEAGVPLARIRELRTVPDNEFRRLLAEIEHDVAARIRTLQHTRSQLRRLRTGEPQVLPADVSRHLDSRAALGFSRRWIAMETDLWILAFATRPGTARELFDDQAHALTDPALRQLYLDHDAAHDLDPHDPAIDALADRIVAATRARYGDGALPGDVASSDVPALAQDAVNDSSPAWRRLDALVRGQLHS